MDVATGNKIKVWQSDASFRWCTKFSADGKILASARVMDGVLELTDADSGQLLRTFKGGIGGSRF